MSNGKLILIIDDTELISTVLKTRLETAGYRVECACGGEEGINKALGVDPDLVLLDVVMPEVDGFDVLRRLRAEEKTKEKPIIMFTAHDETKALLETGDQQMTDYIVKPFNAQDVLEKIAKYV